VKVYPEDVYWDPGAMGNAHVGRVNTLAVPVDGKFHVVADPATFT